MAGGIRDKSKADDLEMNHEINVTPFIDVMLVLLIIFMVAAPLSTVDIHVDLPASTAQTQKRPDKPIYVTLKEDLSLNVGVTPVTRDSLAGMLGQTSDGDKETRIFLRADRAVAYGDIMQVMNLLRNAGYLKIALVGLETLSAVSSAGGADADAGDGVRSGTGEPASQP